MRFGLVSSDPFVPPDGTILIPMGSGGNDNVNLQPSPANAQPGIDLKWPILAAVGLAAAYFIWRR